MSIIGSALWKFEGDSSGLVSAAEKGQKSVQNLSQEQEKYNKVQEQTAQSSKTAQLALTLLGGIISATAVRFTTLAFQTGSVTKAVQLLGSDFVKIGSSIKTVGETAFKFITDGSLLTYIQKLGAGLATFAKIGFEAFTAITTGGLSLLPLFGKLVSFIDLLSIGFAAAATSMAQMGGAAGLLAPIFSALGGASVLLIGVLDILLIKVGGLISSFGGALSQKAREFITVANENQQAMFGLKVAVEGYQRATGDASVTSDEFVKIINKMALQTTITRAEMSRGILTMLDMAQVTGINAEQIASLTQRSADFAAVTGQEFQSVIYAIDQAMRGFPRAAASMGLALKEAELAQTAFVKSLGRGVDELTDAQRATAFYELIMQKTAFTTGKSAVAALETFQGAVNATHARLTIIHQEIGKGIQAAWFPLQQVILNIVTAFAEVNPQFYQFIGGTLAVLGPMLTLTGTLVELAAKLALVAGALGILAYIFPAVRAALVATSVAVTGATVSWTAFGAALLTIFSNPYVLLITGLTVGVIALSGAMGVLAQDTKTVAKENRELFSEFTRLTFQQILTTKEMDRMKEIVQNLANNGYPRLKEALKDFNAESKESARIMREIIIGELGMRLDSIQKEIDRLRKLEDEARKKAQQAGPSGSYWDTIEANMRRAQRTKLAEEADTIDKTIKSADQLKRDLKIEELIRITDAEINKLKIDFEVLGTVTQDVFERKIGQELKKFLAEISHIQGKFVETISEIDDPVARAKAASMFQLIISLSNKTTDALNDLRLRILDISGAFEGPTGALRRQIEIQKKLIDDLKNQTRTPQNVAIIEAQEKVLAQLEINLSDLRKELTNFVNPALIESADRMIELTEATQVLTNSIYDLARDAGPLVSDQLKEIADTLNKELNEKALKDLQSAISGLTTQDLVEFIRQFQTLQTQGLSSIEAIRNALVNMRFDLEKTGIGKEDETTDSVRRAVQEQMAISADTRSTLDRIRGEDLKNEKIKLDKKIELLRTAGATEVEIEQFKLLEIDKLNQERLDRDAQLADAMIRNAQSIGQALQGISKKGQVEWERTWGNIGFFTESVTQGIGQSFSNLLGKTMRGEIKSFKDFFTQFLKELADMWLGIIQKIIAKLIELWMWELIVGIGKKIASGFAGAGTGGAGAGNDTLISPSITSNVGASGLRIGAITSSPNQSFIDHGKPLWFERSFAMGLSSGPIPSGTNRPVPILAHPGEMIVNESQQALIAAGLRGELPGSRTNESGDKDLNITINFARDLQAALKTQPNEISLVVNSEILRNGQLRKTIKRAR